MNESVVEWSLDDEKELEARIQHVRAQLYDACESKLNQDQIIRLSRQLDQLCQERDHLQKVVSSR